MRVLKAMPIAEGDTFVVDYEHHRPVMKPSRWRYFWVHPEGTDINLHEDASTLKYVNVEVRRGKLRHNHKPSSAA
jgi:hypothetical protein